MLFLLILVIFSSSAIFAQETQDVFPLPCYYDNNIIPGRVLDLDNKNFMDSAGDSLRLIANLPTEGGYNRLLMVDCDHDGMKEFIYRGNGAKLYFIENQGANVFTIVDSITGFYYIPLAAGDLDDDGLTDLAVQEGNFVRILESTSSNTFPKTIVWSYSLNGQYGEGRFEQFAQMTDLDEDGKKEITMTSNTFPLLSGYGYVSIFENTTDNNYTRIFYYGLNYPNSILGYIAAGDYDNDNLMEFSCSAGIGDSLYVFETVANDTFRLKFKTYTGLSNEYPVITGNDLDNDGKKEIFVSGDNFSQQGYRNILVYEASSGDLFSLNNTIIQYTGLVGFQPINSGNLFSTGNDELVFEGHRIFIYNAVSNNVFSVRDSSLYYANATNTFCFDINQGGYNELQIIRYSGNVMVFDNPFITGNINGNEYPRIFSLYQNYPNPFNPSTKIKFDLPDFIPPSKGDRGINVQLKVYDILGKEITTLFNGSLKPGSHEVEWNASSYPSGVYFYKLVFQEFNGTKKMVLMK